MASVALPLARVSDYIDARYDGGPEKYAADRAVSKTVYVGNLSFHTAESQIHALFSKIGQIRRIIMGVDRIKRSLCGFCFVEYYLREDALTSLALLNKSVLDGRPIRVDLDPGFVEGRQFGRGATGGQVRDEFREDYDAERGGYGRIYQQQMESAGGLVAAEGVDLLAENRGRQRALGPETRKRGRESDDEDPDLPPRIRESHLPEGRLTANLVSQGGGIMTAGFSTLQQGRRRERESDDDDDASDVEREREAARDHDGPSKKRTRH